MGRDRLPAERVMERKAVLLRLDAALWEAVRRWAADDLRSVNGQIEFLLREAVQKRARGRRADESPGGGREPAAR